MVQAGRTEHHAGDVRRAGVGHAACDRRPCAAVGCGDGCRGEVDRLRMRIEMVEQERPAQAAVHPRTQRKLFLVAPVSVVRGVMLVVLGPSLDPRMGFELLRLARIDQDGGAGRVAGQQRRERPVQHFDVLDFLAADDVPARREIVGIAQQVGQQQSVRIDQRPRTLQTARRAAGNDAVAVADIALAYE